MANTGKLRQTTSDRLYHQGRFSRTGKRGKTGKILSYVKSIVLHRIVLIDVPEEFGIRDTDLLKKLVEMVASDPGFMLNYYSLSKKLGRSKQTIINYIFYLEYSLVIKTVKKMRPGFLSSSRKMRKVYFTNSSFQYAAHGLTYDNLGKVAENAVFQTASPDNYYREGQEEIDFLITRDGKVIPIKVKYGTYEPDRIITPVKKLCLSYGIIVSRDEYKNYERNGVKIRIVPLWLFLLYPDRIDEIQ